MLTGLKNVNLTAVREKDVSRKLRCIVAALRRLKMVMQKVRAFSYLRRTISEPYSKGRFTTGMSQIPETMPVGLVQSLLPSNVVGSFQPITENDQIQYTWKTDAMGLWSLLANHLNIFMIFSPLGILAAQRQWGDLWVFWFNFFCHDSGSCDPG
eukprot:Blabericola_migrator_1__5896@NODE_2985_length_2140_cov_143_014954_g1867_i0_p1_GENE_NODE_2985_length_2140_cov_143_014954_g1867_i0NODE_2985_length_2140_cov_143_014954_g1867_i0_p1_ORF_typecomplete_len154_score2_07DUF473/PF04322_12/0_053Curto_V3/PF07436_11/0_23_NODE_2985_length_2140_cov_143_014954_g1867_i0239700